MMFVQIIVKKRELETEPVVSGSGPNNLIMLRADTLSECPECTLTSNVMLSLILYFRAMRSSTGYQKV